MWFDERVWKFLDFLAVIFAVGFSFDLLIVVMSTFDAFNGKAEWEDLVPYVIALVVLGVLSTICQQAAKGMKQRDPRYRER